MGPTAQENCGSCNGKLPKSGDFATCSACGNGLHFESCSIKKQTWIAMNSSKQAAWVCPTCRKNKKGSTSQPEDEDNNASEDSEVSSLGVQKSILLKVNSLMSMKGQLDNIEASLTFMSEKYDKLLEEIGNLRAENKDLKAEVQSLKSKESSNREFTEKLSIEVADLDQYGRRLNLEIHGLGVQGDPRAENMPEVLKKVAKDIDVEYNPYDIHQAHRLQPRRDGKPPTVIVQFYSKNTRDQWLMHGKKAKISGVFFNENLCMHYRNLLKEAKIRSKTHNYSFVWFRGGRVLVKKGENDPNVLVLKTWDDLKKIK